MKTPKTAEELRRIILAELAHHHDMPIGFDIEVVPDGETFRATGKIDREHAEYGELIARAVEIGDHLAHQFKLATS